MHLSFNYGYLQKIGLQVIFIFSFLFACTFHPKYISFIKRKSRSSSEKQFYHKQIGFT